MARGIPAGTDVEIKIFWLARVLIGLFGADSQNPDALRKSEVGIWLFYVVRVGGDGAVTFYEIVVGSIAASAINDTRAKFRFSEYIIRIWDDGFINVAWVDFASVKNEGMFTANKMGVASGVVI